MGILKKPPAPRVHWSVERGWVVDAKFPLSKAMLKACVEFTIKVQTDRIRSTPPGDRRRQMTEALAQLSVNTLKVNLLPVSDFSDERIIY